MIFWKTSLNSYSIKSTLVEARAQRCERAGMNCKGTQRNVRVKEMSRQNCLLKIYNLLHI
jgi:hypothetical protein